MPVVTIEWFEGRSAAQKQEIAARVTEAVSEVGKTPADQVWIRFVDSAKADWAIGGEIQGERAGDGLAGDGLAGDGEPALGPPD